MTVEALEAEDSVISESLELSKSPFSSFKIARATSKNESEKEVEYSMDENFENDDDEESMDVEKSKMAFSKQFIDSTNRPKIAQNLQNKMSRNDTSDNEKEDEYLDSFIEDDDELVLGGQKFREKADTKKNENDFRLSESFQEIDEDDEVEEEVVKKGGKEKEKDARMRAIKEDNYEKEVDEVEDEDDTFRSNNLSRTTPSQGGGFGAQMGRNLGSKSLPYPSRIDEDEEVVDEDEEIERERGYGVSVGGVSGKGKGKGSIKEVEEDGKEEEEEEEENDYECSYSRDFEQSRSALIQLIYFITLLCVVFVI
jgi:hypothetical protein